MTYETLKSIFENSYPGKKEIFEKLVSPIFNKARDLTSSDRDFSTEVDSSKIKSCTIFAQVGGAFPITFADVELKENVSVKTNRVAIQNCVRRILDNNTNAIIFFHQPESTEWRVSYVHRGSSNKDSTNAKRYTYLCGKNHACRTVSERFLELTNVTRINDEIMLKAFSVETLTKQFYKELFAWYEWAAEIVTFPKGDTTKNSNGEYNVIQTKEKNNLNLIRLITRLMFVWFIKQKNLIPSWIFDKKQLMDILTEFNPESDTEGNYYNAVIQNLFFATLNKKIEDRAFADDERVKNNTQFGVKNYYRDNKESSFFKESNKQIIERFKPVPFLNGGLFECLDKLIDNEDCSKNIEQFDDGFSREPKWMAFVPNHLFWQEDDGSHEGILHILNKYNFTVEENTPSDIQVALDPELLGKVFENLLGSYNPETSETARKDSGSFYTPREIVNFMVDESLKNYLTNKVNDLSENQLDSLFNEANEKYTEPNNYKIIQQLKNIKILDPACGSGAFPMGILQRIVNLIQKCEEKNYSQKDLYELKLELIEKCLYGIDIQPIAVQICKLRFFISLICEQNKTDVSKDNYGFNPLPNLETKFVAADSLIGLKEQQKDVLNLQNDILLNFKNELLEIRKKHFRASSSEEKFLNRKADKEKREEIIKVLKSQISNKNEELIQILKDEIKELQTQIDNLPIEMITISESAGLFEDSSNKVKNIDKNENLRKTLKRQLAEDKKNLEKEESKKYNDQDSVQEIEELVSWNPYDQNAVSSFFDSDWMFNVSDGFDIVIGNPPYIQLQKDSGKLANKYENHNYSTFTKMGDIYCLFYEKGFNFLKSNGHLCFITSNKWMRAGYGDKLREFLATKTNPKLLIDFAGVKVFESATVDTNILLFSKSQNENKTTACLTKNLTIDGLANLSDFVRQNSSSCNFSTSDNWVILSNIEQSIKRKIESIGTPLKEWDIQINYGIKTGFNDAFIISTEKRNEILNNCTSEEERKKTDELIRPILRGRDIKRYGYDWANLWLINTHNGIKEKNISRINVEKDYPAIKKHLDKYWDKLEKRADQGDTPYNLRNCAYMDDFNKPRIIYKEIGTEMDACMIEKGIMINNKLYMISGENLIYLLVLFNSKLFNRIILQSANLTGGKGVDFFDKIKVIKPNNSLINRIKELLALKDNVGLNKIIYNLYNLSQEEINWIEIQ